MKDEKDEVPDMKKNMITKLAIALALILVITASGCRKNDTGSSSHKTDRSSSEQKESDSISLYTGSYNLAVPTGTREPSDEPDMPEEIVYWDPQRDLKAEYTLKEATEKYAFIVDYTTLIYTACDELQTQHKFICVDYGSHLFSNHNSVTCLDSEGKVLKGNVSYLDLATMDGTSADQVISELPYKFVGPMRSWSYSEETSSLDIRIIEHTEDHVLVHIRDSKDEPSHEALYYAKPVGGTWILVIRNVWNTQTAYLEDKDIPVFTHYAEILLNHLGPDDGKEPYIYDKIVNTPFLGGMRLSGFNYLSSAGTSSISLRTRRDDDLYNITIIQDPKNTEEFSDWEDMGGMKSQREFNGSQKLYFTVDGVSYLCSFQNKKDEYTDFDSSEEFLDFVRDHCYIR